MWTKSTIVWFRDDLKKKKFILHFFFLKPICPIFNDMKLQISNFFLDQNNIFVKEKRIKKRKRTKIEERERERV